MASELPASIIWDAVHPSWIQPLTPVIGDLQRALGAARADWESGAEVWPAPEHILRAFQQPFDAVRILIVGQDPYPTPGHAVGLAFSTRADTTPIPASLRNISQELHNDVGASLPSGDLSHWVDHGVLLLNRVLTVRAGEPGSHRKLGWEEVTDQVIRALADRDEPLVAILWGRDAQTLQPLLGDSPAITSPHPSPLSARRGFFGSRPFSRANELLIAQGGEAITW